MFLFFIIIHCPHLVYIGEGDEDRRLLTHQLCATSFASVEVKGFRTSLH